MNYNLSRIQFLILSIPLTIILGVQLGHIVSQILNNGVQFALPYLFIIPVVLVFVFVEYDLIKSLKQEENTSSKYGNFLRSIISFDTLFSSLFIGFVSLIEVIVFFELTLYFLGVLFKEFFNRSSEISMGSFSYSFIVIALWILVLYVRLLLNTNAIWAKIINTVKGFLILFFSISFIYSSDLFFASLSKNYETYVLNSNLYLKPVSLWSSNVWIQSIGQVFVLAVSGYLILKLVLSYNKNFDDNSPKSIYSNRVKLIFSGFVVFLILVGFLLYVSKSYYLHYLIGFYERFLTDKFILDVVVVFIISVIAMFLGLMSSVSVRVFKNPLIDSFSIIDTSTGYLSNRLIIFVSFVLFGLLSSALFIKVIFEEFYIWNGHLFLLILFAILLIQVSYYFKIKFDKFPIRLSLKRKPFNSDKNRMQYTVYSFFLLVFIFLLPSTISNFFFNNSNSSKIEYLQDLGKITSNHYEREPFIFKDYYPIIQAIDSNRLVLDQIDSLQIIQKDSIKFYLENRNYKQNENLRIEKLQFYHDLVYVKWISKVSFYLICLLLLYLLFLEYRKRKI